MHIGSHGVDMYNNVCHDYGKDYILFCFGGGGGPCASLTPSAVPPPPPGEGRGGTYFLSH